MKFIVIVMAALFLFPAICQASSNDFDYNAFGQIPIQYDGRIEPLDSFARAFLVAISGHENVDHISAIKWLAETTLKPNQAYSRQIFNVANSQVRHALNLPERPLHRYAFSEIAQAMDNQKSMIDALIATPEKNSLDPAQQQLLGLHHHALLFFEISRSLSVISFSSDKIETDKETQILRIIPPQWSSSGGVWLSPWATLQNGQGSPQTAELLRSWEALAKAYNAHDAIAWNEAAKDTLTKTFAIAQGAARPAAIKVEYFYNRAHLFAISLGFYLFALLAALSMRIFSTPLLYKTSLVFLSCGAFVHFLGIALRIFVMMRPPVGTLYESILFVSLIAVIGSMLVELKDKHGRGLAIGAFIGSVLQIIGMAFAGDGGTMGTLVAVLNTNFLLATHVIAITTGYGCCLVASLLGHLWLFQKIFYKNNKRELDKILRWTLTATLIALLFTATGTVLGGVWADQSWGRFWGWDPKENGALLIVLWLIWVLHGRISGLFRPELFAASTALTVIIVAISWFGVNLLNVGLHSYGFTSSGALSLCLFVIFDFIIVVSSLFFIEKARAV